MVRRSLVALVALATVLAGCSSPLGVVTDGGGGGGGNGLVGGPDTETVQPWSETEFVVTLSGTATGDTDYAPIVQSTLSYWEDNAETYLGHPVQFRFVPDAASPDVVVTLVDSIDQCGTEDHAAGCSPYVTDLRRHDETVDVRIQRGFGRESTLLVLKHEFGHALGLRHDDEPAAVMQSQAALATAPQPNATDRSVPWADATLSVYVDEANVSAGDRATVRQQVQHALDYYAAGAEGAVPENVSFTTTDNRSGADVTVVFPETLPCGPAGESPQSCALITGPDPDRDGARETYNRLDIYLSTMAPEAVGWHVGRWLATGMGLSESELPPPFVDASYRDRRSDWWR